MHRRTTTLAALVLSGEAQPRRTYRGANNYSMSYAGTSKTAAIGSRPDWVAAP